MDLAPCFLIMANTMMDNFTKDKNMEKANTFGQTILYIKETGLKGLLMVL